MASNQTIGVNLKFSADVNAAKQAMQGLQTQLTQISNMQPGAHLGTQLASQLGQAQHAASQLRISLSQAFNQDTGRLNLNKFNQQMKQGGMSLEKYKAQLSAIGPQGQQAFNQLAFSIATAEAPILNLNDGIRRLGATFMNTFRYQLSSSVIMGFLSGIQEAVDYTKELNTSLNNIRIVTDYGAEEMEKFANQANKAAKALSTTTTAMTNASLIYFQQGLNMEEAQKRAETTVKLANVTGQAVETVSDQLTAVWNNFYDGTQSLEYYADVLTALGAATASSSEEISEGLEKFAAIANTVGLSYEYATSALATVTSTTRQSADVVGTAFKTLFARMQDLELGKSLEDGVTLGKYAEGLQAIGVNVLDSSGNLKEMNTILDEMGAKWGTLSKAQQVSVAQTVAGTRQYSQLIALMDNWDKFQANLTVAQGSSGELQKQQDVYAESWEAAAERVTAALETIWNKILDDDFFIDMLDSFTKVLDMVDGLIEGLNGLPGILSLVGAALFKAFGPQIAAGVNNIASSVMSMTASGRAKIENQRLSALEGLKVRSDKGGFEGMEADNLSRRASLAQQRIKADKNLNANQRAVFELEENEFSAAQERHLNSQTYQDNKKTVDDANILKRATLRTAELRKNDTQLSQAVVKGGDIKTAADIDTVINNYKQIGIEINKVSDGATKKFSTESVKAVQNYIKELEKLRTVLQDVSKDTRAQGVAKAAVTRSGNKIQPGLGDPKVINTHMTNVRQGVVSGRLMETVGVGAVGGEFASIATKDTSNTQTLSSSLAELKSRLSGYGVTSMGVSQAFETDVGKAGGVSKVNGEEISHYQRYAQAVEAAEAAVRKLNEARQQGDSATITGAEGEVDAALENVNKLSNAIENNSAKYVERNEAALRNNGITEEVIISEEGAANAFAEERIEAMRANQQLDEHGNRLNEAGTKAVDFGQQITTLGNAMMSLSMAVNSIKGIFDVLNNEEMTFWEKLLSITTTLGMAIPMVVSGFQALSALELKSTAIKAANALATWGQVQAEKEQVKVKGKNLILQIKENIEVTKNTAKKGTNKLVNSWNEGALSKSSRFELQKSGKYKGQYKILSGDGAGGFADKKVAGEMAGKEALKGLGKGALKAGLTVAVMAAIVAASKWVYDQADELYNKDENAAKRAEQAAKNLSEAYGKAAAKFNELDAASKSYADGVSSLEELTKGTLEYQEGVSAANEEALKLINTYDELAGQYHTTAEGLIVFNEGALENIRLLEMQRKNTAAMASTLANQNAREARTQADTTKFLREDIKSNENSEFSTEDKSIISKHQGVGLAGGAVTGAGAAMLGAKFGGLIGTAAGPLGTLIGAGLGAAAGLIVTGLSGVITAVANDKEATKKEQSAINKLSKAYSEIGEQALTKDNMTKILGEGNSDLIDSLDANREELTKLMQEIKANTKARKAENTNLARQMFTAQDAAFSSFDSDIQSAMSKLTGDYITKREDEIDRERSYYTKGRWYTLGIARSTKEGRDQFQEYLDDQGIKISGNARFSREGIKYTYIEDNEEKSTVLDYETLEAWQEGKEISKEVSDNYEKIKDTIFELSEQDGGEGLVKLLGGQDVNDLTKQEFEGLKAAYESGKFATELAQLGVENGENYIKAVENAINNWDESTAFTRYARKIRQELDTIFQTGATDIDTKAGDTEIKAQALENYSKALMENSEALNGNAEALNQWGKADKSKIAAEMAVANAKFAKGVVYLNEVMEDSIDVLMEWNEESLDTWEAVAKVQDALEDVFGIKVSADYVEEHLEDIQKLAKGDVSELERLQQAAAKDFILNLAISDESKYNMLSMIEGFIKEAEAYQDDIKLEVGAAMNLDSYTEQLNEMLKAGDITAEEVKKTFAAIGYAVDIKTKKVPTTTHQTYTVQKEDGPAETWKVDTTTITEVPYIAGENTYNPGETTTTASGEKVTTNYQEKGTGFTYTGGNKTKGNALSTITEESKKEKKKLIDSIERYTEIKEKLSDIERALDRIAKAKDRAFGQAKLDLMDQELAKQKELIATEEEYYRELQKGYQEDWKHLDSRFKLDEKGRISNYDEVLKSLVNSGMSEEKFNEIKEAADKYRETLNELEAQQDKLIDVNNTFKDMELEKIEYNVEFKITLNDDAIKQLEYQLSKLDDPVEDAAEAIAKLGAVAMKNKDNVAEYLSGIEDILGQPLTEGMDLEALAQSSQLTDKQIASLRNYRDQLINTSESLDAFYEQVMEKVNGAFEEMNSDSEKAINRIEQLGSTLKTYQNIIDLVGKKNLGVTDEQMRALSRAQVEQAQTNLKTKKAQLDMNQEALRAAQQQLEAARGTNAEEHWEKEVESIQEKVWQLENEVEQSWESMLQTAADDYANAISTVMESFEKSMSGIAGSFEELQNKYDQYSEISERYLADYEKIYELSKLNRDLSKTIDESSNVQSKSKLRDLQEEINSLQQSNTKMTKYEVDELRARYDLKVAEIALEEAQNAKSQVRMTRDSEGNWGYVYTADQASIDNALQNYEDKLYSYQSLTQDYIKEMESQIVNLPREYAEAMRAIANDMTLTEEERKKKMEELTEYYTEKYGWLTEQLGMALEDSKWLYDNDWKDYSKATGYKISDDQKWQDQFTETIWSQITGYQSLEDAQNTFKENATTMISSISSAFGQWNTDLQTAFKNMGISLDDFSKDGGTLDTKIQAIIKKLGDVNTAYSNYYEKATSGFGEIVRAAGEQYTLLDKEMQKYQNLISNTVEQLTKLIELAGTEIKAPTIKETVPEGVRTDTGGGDTTQPGYHGSKADTGIYTKEQIAKIQKWLNETFGTTLKEDGSWGKNSQSTAESLGYDKGSLAKVGAAWESAQNGYSVSTYGEGKSDIIDGGLAKNIFVSSSKEGFLNEISYSANEGLFKLKHDEQILLFEEDVLNKFLLDHGYSNVDDIIQRKKQSASSSPTNSYESVLKKNFGVFDSAFSFEAVDKDEMYYIPISWRSGKKAPENNVIKKAHFGLSPGKYVWVPLDSSNGEEGYLQYYGSSNVVGGVVESKDRFQAEELQKLINSEYLKRFDTGGYTGSWDSSGRLAMLHQKEIVLNAHDTENFLAAVNIVRDIASAIDLQALSYQHQLAQLAQVNAVGGSPQTLQQEVTIHAEFPNARERSEIEAAFDSLLNRASQFANRKN